MIKISLLENILVSMEIYNILSMKTFLLTTIIFGLVFSTLSGFIYPLFGVDYNKIYLDIIVIISCGVIYHLFKKAKK